MSAPTRTVPRSKITPPLFFMVQNHRIAHPPSLGVCVCLFVWIQKLGWGDKRQGQGSLGLQQWRPVSRNREGRPVLRQGCDWGSPQHARTHTITHTHNKHETKRQTVWRSPSKRGGGERNHNAHTHNSHLTHLTHITHHPPDPTASGSKPRSSSCP